jgi:hypothetical protein
MENHKFLSLPMKAVIEYVITNSVQFCQDMRMDMTEEELEEMSVKDFRNQILDNATVFFAQELEPDGNADVPPHIVTCIKERVAQLSIGQLIGLIPLSLR